MVHRSPGRNCVDLKQEERRLMLARKLLSDLKIEKFGWIVVTRIPSFSMPMQKEKGI